MDLHKHNISLSMRQKNRLRKWYKKRRAATVSLAPDQLSKGDHTVLLTDEQHKAVNKALRNNNGLGLTISYDQLLKNKGGLLNKVFIEDNIPYAKKTIPLIKKQAASALMSWTKVLKAKRVSDWMH